MNLILKFLSATLISFSKNKNSYIIAIVLIIGYFFVDKYHFEAIKKLKNQLKLKDEIILECGVKISNLKVEKRQLEVGCNNKVLEVKQHSIQEQLYNSIKEINKDEKDVPNSIGKHTLNLND